MAHPETIGIAVESVNRSRFNPGLHDNRSCSHLRHEQAKSADGTFTTDQR